MPIHTIICSCGKIVPAEEATFNVGQDDYYCFPCNRKIEYEDTARELEGIREQMVLLEKKAIPLRIRLRELQS